MENEKFDFHEIKTFEDACRRLGFSAETFLILAYTGDTEAFLQANAFYKLMIIQKAINNGVWCDEEGWSYYPFWLFYSNEKKERKIEKKKRTDVRYLSSDVSAYYTGNSNVHCVSAHLRGIDTTTDCGLSLCFNSKEAAQYAANQFEDLFLQYYGIKQECNHNKN